MLPGGEKITVTRILLKAFHYRNGAILHILNVYVYMSYLVLQGNSCKHSHLKGFTRLVRGLVVWYIAAGRYHTGMFHVETFCVRLTKELSKFVIKVLSRVQSPSPISMHTSGQGTEVLGRSL